MNLRPRYIARVGAQLLILSFLVSCAIPTESTTNNSGQTSTPAAKSPLQELRFVTGGVAAGQTTAWFPFGTLTGLDYRMKADANKFGSEREFYVQFRNRYVQTIHMSYGMRGSSAPTATCCRIHLAQNGTTGDEGFFFAVDGASLYVLITSIRFGATDDGPYITN